MMYSVEVTINDIVHVEADDDNEAHEQAVKAAVELFDVDEVQVTTDKPMVIK
jgi:hypothetical protein